MRQLLRDLGLSLLLGWTAGAVESAVVVLVAGPRILHPLAEPAGVALLYTGAAAILWLLATIALRLRSHRAGVLPFLAGLLLFLVLGDWLHEQWLAEATFLEPASLAASAALVLAAAGFGLLLARLAARHPGPLAGALLFLAGIGHGVVWLQGSGTSPPPSAGPEAADATTAQRPDLVFLLVDTLRADHLGCYGHEEDTSPVLDRLAAEGVRCATAMAQAPWTRASVASLFTSLYPGSHDTNSLFQRLPAALPTLAEELQAAGYRTAAFSANVNVSPTFGFDQGFASFWLHDTTALLRFTAAGRLREWLRDRIGATAPFEGLHGNDARTVNQAVFAWLERVTATRARGDRRPLFLYVQYIDPHFPYWPPEWLLDGPAPDAAALHRRARIPHAPPPFPFGRWPEQETEVVAGLQRLYDGEIRFVDREIGRLLDELQVAGILDRALVVVTSDHGEEFLEHGQAGHGQSLFQELLHVPLILRGPGLPAGRVVTQPVELLDLYPTLLRRAGLEPPPGIHGRDLSPLLEGRELPPRPLLAEKLAFSPLVGILDGRWKLIQVRHEGEERWLLYDMEADPGEQEELSAREPELLGRLRRVLAAATARAAALKQAEAERVEIDAATYETLRSLGYIGGG